MKHDSTKTNRIVAAFVLVGIMLLALFSAIIVINNKTFADKTHFKTILDNAKGLSAKPAIFFKGLEIGRIEQFSLNSRTNEIEVTFWVYDQYKDKIVKYAVLAGQQNSLFGEVLAFDLLLPSIVKVKYFEPLDEGDTIPHISSDLAQAYIRNGFIAPQSDSIDSIIASVNTLLLNLQKENNPEAGSLFRILDRVAKITDHLLSVSEALRKSSILPEAETAIKEGKDWLAQLPKTMEQFSAIMASTDELIKKAQTTLTAYQQPAGIVGEVTQGKVPEVLDNLNASLSIMQEMLKEVHAEREQLAITVHEVQQVLEKLDKTLQGLNNNPLLREGIVPESESSGIEMHE